MITGRGHHIQQRSILSYKLLFQDCRVLLPDLLSLIDRRSLLPNPCSLRINRRDFFPSVKNEIQALLRTADRSAIFKTSWLCNRLRIT